MKNLFFCVLLALFAVAWTANLNRNVHDVQIRVKRQFGNWFKQDSKAKAIDKKKGKKNKKNKKKHKTTSKPTTTLLTTLRPTTLSTSAAPTPAPAQKVKMPESELKKILKMKSRKELEKYLGISEQKISSIMANYTKNLPKDLARAALGQSELPANPNCGCSPTLKRVFIKNDQNSGVAINYPGCMATFHCGGSCLNDELQECVPTQKRYVEHYVLAVFHKYVGKLPEYKKHVVEFHHGCDCRCRPKKCHDKQYFNNDQCSCKCRTDYTPERLKCSEKSLNGHPMEYDEDTCSCKCPYNRHHCDSPKVWDNKLCKCQLPCPKCPPGQAPNKDDCHKCEIVAMRISNNCQ